MPGPGEVSPEADFPRLHNNLAQYRVAVAMQQQFNSGDLACYARSIPDLLNKYFCIKVNRELAQALETNDSSTSVPVIFRQRCCRLVKPKLATNAQFLNAIPDWEKYRPEPAQITLE
jgi:hypothetical protein